MPFGIKPIGLGARDTLRLEMAFPLYGHELDETKSFLNAGLQRFVDFKKNFIGKEALLRQEAEGVRNRLIGFKTVSEGIPREGYEIYKGDEKVGVVTSGNLSPILRKGIGLGYVSAEEAREGNEILILIRHKKIPAEIVRTPFYKKSKDGKIKREGKKAI